MRFGMRPRGLVVAALAISAVVVASASANGGQRGLRFEAPQISQGAQALRTAAESPPLLFPSLDALAPSLGGTFGTINFDEQATTSGYYSTPPDNSAAAGPNQVIDTANTVIE